jgi:hypothetical protein
VIWALHRHMELRTRARTSLQRPRSRGNPDLVSYWRQVCMLPHMSVLRTAIKQGQHLLGRRVAAPMAVICQQLLSR